MPAVLVALFAAGCGGSSASSAAKTAINAQDQQHATASLLRLGDFPTGWRAESSTSSSGNAEDCLKQNFSDLTVTGNAESKDFVHGDATFAASIAAVFKTPAQADTAFKVFASKDLAQCFTAYMKKQSDSNVKVADASWGQLKFPHYADRSAAYQIAIALQTGGLTPTAYVDLIPLERARTVAVLVFVDVFSPFDEQQKEHLAGVVAGRM